MLCILRQAGPGMGQVAGGNTSSDGTAAAPVRTIAFVASGNPSAREAAATLSARYGNVDPPQADMVVALGGDGLMLQTQHRFMGTGKPVYGMNKGPVGFLMNEFAEDGLLERLTAAQRSVVHT